MERASARVVLAMLACVGCSPSPPIFSMQVREDGSILVEDRTYYSPSSNWNLCQSDASHYCRALQKYWKLAAEASRYYLAYNQAGDQFECTLDVPRSFRLRELNEILTALSVWGVEAEILARVTIAQSPSVIRVIASSREVGPHGRTPGYEMVVNAQLVRSDKDSVVGALVESKYLGLQEPTQYSEDPLSLLAVDTYNIPNGLLVIWAGEGERVAEILPYFQPLLQRSGWELAIWPFAHEQK